jgi:hypothetical protein
MGFEDADLGRSTRLPPKNFLQLAAQRLAD